jgi:capsular exopolysaccharide synthesis family protein
VEETIELRQYAHIIRKWLWLVILAAVLAGAVAYVVSITMPPVYRASATLLISEAGNSNASEYQDILSSERKARTYAELLQKRPILEGTAAHLGLRDVDVKELPFAVDVQPVRDTQLIELAVEANDPGMAARAANALPQVFIEQNEAMQSQRFASSKDNLSQQMAGLEEDIERTEEAIARLSESTAPADRDEVAHLESLLAQHRGSYSSLLQSYEEVRLAETTSVDSVIVVEPADVPRDPVKPRKYLNTLLASVVGCMLALGIAFLIEYLDDTIKSPSDITEVLGLSSLAIIPRIPGKELADRLVTVGHSRSPISEAYRALRTNIQFSSPDKPLRTLLVTSASPSEGKSLTVANLGVVMAQAGQRIVLVDSDLRRPTLHKLFGLSNESGLTNALFSEEPGLDQFLQPAPTVENLRVLTSGPLPPNPSELLGSQRMQELVGRLEAHADVVLFDSPPILPVTDAAILTNLVDGTILVTDAGGTRREMAQHAKQDLDQVGANILGVSLNRISLNGGSGHYYYYYHYYYADGEQRRRHEKKSLGKRLRGLISMPGHRGESW